MILVIETINVMSIPIGDVTDYTGYDCSLRTCPYGKKVINAYEHSDLCSISFMWWFTYSWILIMEPKSFLNIVNDNLDMLVL